MLPTAQFITGKHVPPSPCFRPILSRASRPAYRLAYTGLETAKQRLIEACQPQAPLAALPWALLQTESALYRVMRAQGRMHRREVRGTHSERGACCPAGQATLN